MCKMLTESGSMQRNCRWCHPTAPSNTFFPTRKEHPSPLKEGRVQTYPVLPFPVLSLPCPVLPHPQKLPKLVRNNLFDTSTAASPQLLQTLASPGKNQDRKIHEKLIYASFLKQTVAQISLRQSRQLNVMAVVCVVRFQRRINYLNGTLTFKFLSLLLTGLNHIFPSQLFLCCYHFVHVVFSPHVAFRFICRSKAQGRDCQL